MVNQILKLSANDVNECKSCKSIEIIRECLMNPHKCYIFGRLTLSYHV